MHTRGSHGRRLRQSCTWRKCMECAAAVVTPPLPSVRTTAKTDICSKKIVASATFWLAKSLCVIEIPPPEKMRYAAADVRKDACVVFMESSSVAQGLLLPQRSRKVDCKGVDELWYVTMIRGVAPKTCYLWIMHIRTTSQQVSAILAQGPC